MKYETKAAKNDRATDKQKLHALEYELAQTQAREADLLVAVRYGEHGKREDVISRAGRPNDLNALTETQTAALFKMRDQERECFLLPIDERAWLEDHGFGVED